MVIGKGFFRVLLGLSWMGLGGSLASAQTFGEALNATNGLWRTGGDAPWVLDRHTILTGRGPIHSGVVTQGQESWVEVRFAGPASLTAVGRGSVNIFSSTDLCRDFNYGGSLSIDAPSWFVPSTFSGSSNLVRFTHSGSGLAYLDQLQIVLNTNSPSILSRPTDQYACSGPGTVSSASFAVVATGAEPLSYFWFKDGLLLHDDERISGSSTATLQLTNLLPTDAGTYSVLVSNSWGQMLSGTATGAGTSQECGSGARLFITLIISVQGPILTAVVNNGQIQLQFPAVAEHVIQVLASTNLSDWEVVFTGTNILDLLSFSEPTTLPARFYRVREVPY